MMLPSDSFVMTSGVAQMVAVVSMVMFVLVVIGGVCIRKHTSPLVEKLIFVSVLSAGLAFLLGLMGYTNADYAPTPEAQTRIEGAGLKWTVKDWAAVKALEQNSYLIIDDVAVLKTKDAWRVIQVAGVEP